MKDAGERGGAGILVSLLLLGLLAVGALGSARNVLREQAICGSDRLGAQVFQWADGGVDGVLAGAGTPGAEVHGWDLGSLDAPEAVSDVEGSRLAPGPRIDPPPDHLWRCLAIGSEPLGGGGTPAKSCKLACEAMLLAPAPETSQTHDGTGVQAPPRLRLVAWRLLRHSKL